MISVNTRRRLWLKGAAAYFVGGIPYALAAKRCLKTPKQTEGPFYPLQWPDQNNVDLTKGGRAQGEIIVVRGSVLDTDCAPIANAIVDVWQANRWGRYRHPKDSRNASPIDPHFYGLGRVKTQKSGEFVFKTIKPGSYAVGPNWQRPPHLHFKVWVNRETKVTTQMYFADEPLNDPDLIINSLSTAERSNVIVPFSKTKGISSGVFHLHIPI
jgi:protocatechuate 3,4-dioxygenase beta subunit